MKKLSERIKTGLKKEAQSWDSSIVKERPEEMSGLLDKAQTFVARRPPRQPVSVRFDEELSPDWVEREKKVNADTRPGIVASTPSKALKKKKK